MKKNNELSLIICAYKESPYLEECIKSLINQKTKCEVAISTSTPNKLIEELAKKYNIELYVNKKSNGYYDDFLFAFNKANTNFVTLCHQDDVYLEDFATEVIKKIEKNENILISFSNYYDYKNEKIIKNSKLLFVKRVLNFLLKFKIFQNSKFIRRRILSLGNPICSPTVTFNKKLINEPVVKCPYRTSHDWYTWIDFSKKKGKFVYISKPLILRRINELSETTTVIADNSKQKSDFEIFKMFWPEKIAKILLKVYSTSEKNNIIESSNEEKKEMKHKMSWIWPVLYVICTVLGLILYKYGTTKEFGFLFENGNLSIKMNVISIIGLAMYLLSFMLYILILPKYDVTYILPIVSTATGILIFVSSIVFLGEPSNLMKWIGYVIMTVGVIIVNFFGTK